MSGKDNGDNHQGGPQQEAGNVISFESRRQARQKERERAPLGAAPGEDGPQTDGEGLSPLPGRITWLHCPTCGTLEYTELYMEGGRVHKCGSMVEEAVVEVDIRADLTLAEANLERLEALEAHLEATRRLYEEYRKRLLLMVESPPELYPLSPERMQKLPVAEVDPLGLLVPQALHNPTVRFAGKAAEDPEEPA